MTKITLNDLLKRLKKAGLPITRRTFEFYQKQNLLPKPIKHVGLRGRGVYGYYDFEVVKFILEKIQTLKEGGCSLGQISDAFEQKTVDQYMDVLRKYGFSDISLPELTGADEKTIKEANKTLRNLITEQLELCFKDFSSLDGKVKDAIIDFYTPDVYRKRILKELSLWDADEKFDFVVCNHIKDGINTLLPGVVYSLAKVVEKLRGEKDEQAKVSLEAVFDDLSDKLKKLGVLKITTIEKISEIKKWVDAKER